MMQTRLVPIGSLTDTDEHRWRELAARAAEPNPFFEPDFLVLSARHFEGYAKTILVVAEDEGALRGVLPVVAVERRRVPPRPVGTTIGRPTAVTALCTPLVDRDHVDAAVGALLTALSDGARQRQLPGVLNFQQLGDDGAVAAALRRLATERGLPLYARDSWVRGTVTRQGRMDNPLDGQRRRSIGRRRRQLAKELDKEVTVSNRSHDPGSVDDFLRMEASGWKGQGPGSAFALDESKASWFREWFERMSPTDRVIMLALDAGDIPIAMQCFVRGGPGVFWLRSAYDEEYSRYAPGAMLLSSVIEHVRDNTDAEWIDSCTDKDNAFCLEMLPERRVITTLMVGTGGSIDRRLVSALPLMDKALGAQRDLKDRVRKRRPKGTETAAAPASEGSDESADASPAQ